MSNAQAFGSGEGDRWFERNKHKLNADNDPVLMALDDMLAEYKPEKVLEIGCSNGFRLEAMAKKYGCCVWGIDPSEMAITEARKKGVVATNGYANSLPYVSGAFDTVIFGFCLYLCDRTDLFQVVKEADRVLMDKGRLIILDFEWEVGEPFKRKYEHKEGVFSYHQDYSFMFLANPAYETEYCASGVEILMKDINKGWPLCE